MGRNKNRNKKKELFPQNISEAVKPEFLNNSNSNSLNSDSVVPIDIISRLNYPFLKPNINDVVSEDEQEEFEFNFRPRTVFAYNLCLVCMELCDGSASCEICKMVSYCSVR